MTTLNKRLLDELVSEVYSDLDNLGIDVPPQIEYEVSARLTRKLGYCQWIQPFNRIRIVLSSHVDTHDARDTLMHEVLHAVAGAHCGHGGEWKYLAHCVSKKYPQKYNIERLSETTEATKAIRLETRKKQGGAKVTCEKCHMTQLVTKRHRIYKTKSVKGYSCKCGGTLKLEVFE